MTAPLTPSKPFPWQRGVIALGVLLVIGLIWGATRSDPQAPSVSSVPTASADTRLPVALSGDGEANSEKVEMHGDYSFVFEVTGSCYYSADLNPDEGRAVSVFTASDQPQTGDGYVYDLDGIYYLRMITGPSPACGWSISFSPS